MTPHQLERDDKHRYWCVNPEHKTEPCHGVIFQSVTTILGKAVPKNLAWHGQTRGVIGVKGLLRIAKYNVKAMKPGEIGQACVAEGIISPGVWQPNPADRVKLGTIPKYDVARMSPDAIIEALKREHLTVNDHRDERGKHGSALHAALENYAKHGTIPAASTFPEHERPRMRALATFIVEYRPRFIATEVKTLSVKHAFAGTFDLLAYVRAETYEDKGLLKMRPARSDTELRALIDLKTGKWVYPTEQFSQLEAYEGARVEAGEDPTDVRAVLWVNADGDMQLVPSAASFSDFLALKASAEVISRLDKSWRRPRKARA